jgi:Fe-S cluster biogenesis protein NfuA
MFIQTEETPNPAVLKFIPGREVAGDAGAHEFTDAESAAASPLAAAVFEVEGVKRVYFGADFLTVTKADALEWKHLKAPLLAAIMEHYTSGAPVLAAGNPALKQRSDSASKIQHDTGAYEGDAAQIVAEIKELLDTRVRPAVAQDGGDILFDRFEPESGVVFLHMRGACAGCPSSSATLKAGVENMLKHYVPEVTAVEQSL